MPGHLLPAFILLLAVPKLGLKLGFPFFLVLGLQLAVANRAISISLSHTLSLSSYYHCIDDGIMTYSVYPKNTTQAPP
jgi:hypothetical protein